MFEKGLEAIRNILRRAGVDSKYWKEGSSYSKPAISLDLNYDTAFEKIEKLIQYDGILVSVVTVIKEQSYVEIMITVDEFSPGID